MANEEHLRIVSLGVSAWNAWRREHPGIVPDLSGADLTGADLRHADLSAARLGKTILFRADLREADLHEADLCRANLRRTYAAGASLRGAHLRGANLHEASLTPPRLFSRSQHTFLFKYLPTDLQNADLAEAELRAAGLDMALLRHTNFSGACLERASLWRADLSYANLRGANLICTNLSGAYMGGADLSSCTMGNTILSDLDLSLVRGLNSVRHVFPSTLGIDTLYSSGGRIPRVFLRQAGVPAQFIEYISSLVGQAIQYYSCFISYAGEDKHFCDRLYADLLAHDVRVWYFPEDARWGKRVWPEIDKGIRLYDKLVVICSRHSLQSEAVLKEIDIALREERDRGKDVLFPVRLDDYMFDEWGHEHKQAVLDRVVGDFRGWDFDHARYQTQFKRLVDALEAEAQIWGASATAAGS